MSNVASILDRNLAFAASDARQHVPALPFIPFLNLYIVICIDCRVDRPRSLGSSWAMP
jgi:carbonic anhydrase